MALVSQFKTTCYKCTETPFKWGSQLFLKHETVFQIAHRLFRLAKDVHPKKKKEKPAGQVGPRSAFGFSRLRLRGERSPSDSENCTRVTGNRADGQPVFCFLFEH